MNGRPPGSNRRKTQEPSNRAHRRTRSDGARQLIFLCSALAAHIARPIPLNSIPTAMEARSQPRHRATMEDKKPTPATSGSRQVPNSFSPLAFHADAPLYIPGTKTRIPAEPVTYEHICDST